MTIAVDRTEDGRAYVGHDCTLDGKPAIIIGRALDFGIVSHYPQGLRVEYAWPTIARVMSAGGGFKS
jgi:hypothetical protein